MRNLVLLSLLFASSALAAPPSFTQQGRLFDASGVPLTGTHDLHFGLWDAPSGGQAAWTEDQLAVSFDGGYYAVDLGQVQPLQLTTFELDNLWLSIAVDSGPALPTRLPLASVPYALTAQQLRGGSVDATEVRVGGTLVVDADSTIGWASLRDAPQVLGALGCSDGQLARAATSGWVCAAANDHTHGAEQIVSGTLSTTVLPVGTSADSISAGNHTHDLATLPGTLTAAQASQLQPADIGAASSADLSAASAQAAADLSTAAQRAADDLSAHATQAAADLDAVNSAAQAGIATATATASTNLGAHAANASAHHTRYANTEAVAAVKAGVVPADIGAASTGDVSAARTDASAALSAHATQAATDLAAVDTAAQAAVASAAAKAASDLSTHTAKPAAHHARYTNTEAVAAVKAGVTLADLQAGTVQLAVNTSTTCTSAGLLRYNAGVQYCDGSAWQALANAPAPGSGTTADSAATSCKTLLAQFPGTPSGLYWIDPTNSGNPALAWRTSCDMTVDGGGWTLVAYAGDNSAGFPRMDINAGAWDPAARSGKASRGAVSVAKVSSEMALAYHSSLNFAGNLGDTTDTVSFTIPNPSAVTFTTSANAGSCVAVTARRLRPNGSNAACVGSSSTVPNRTSTNAAVNCNPSSGVSTAGVWTQSLGGTYSGQFAYGLYTTESTCNSWPNISHHWWVDAAYYNWEPSATQYWAGAVNGSTAIWLR